MKSAQQQWQVFSQTGKVEDYLQYIALFRQEQGAGPGRPAAGGGDTRADGHHGAGHPRAIG